ncbi:MAG: hypothetical protein ACOCXJ_03795 [Planctomycetota bacterium]
MRYLTVPCVAPLLLLMVACGGGGSRPLADADVNQFLELRTYRLETGDVDPQPEWSPDGRWLLVRSERSLLLLHESGRRRHRVHGGRRPGHPAWIANDRIVFGPDEWFSTSDDGRIVIPTEGLVVVGVEAGGIMNHIGDLTDGAWRPEPWGPDIIAQRGGHLIRYDSAGRGELYDEGYFAVPHPEDTDAIAFQTTPMVAPDHWTGKQSLGHLVVRWPDRSVTLHEGLVEAAWTGDDGIVATRLAGLPPDPARWWSVDTEVVHIAGPEAEPVVVMQGARHPSPHPDAPVVAVHGPDDAIYLCDRDGGYQRQIEASGRAPYWSPDGYRLAMEQVDPDGGSVELAVKVFKIRD